MENWPKAQEKCADSCWPKKAQKRQSVCSNEKSKQAKTAEAKMKRRPKNWVREETQREAGRPFRLLSLKWPAKCQTVSRTRKGNPWPDMWSDDKCFLIPKMKTTTTSGWAKVLDSSIADKKWRQLATKWRPIIHRKRRNERDKWKSCTMQPRVTAGQEHFGGKCIGKKVFLNLVRRSKSAKPFKILSLKVGSDRKWKSSWNKMKTKFEPKSKWQTKKKGRGWRRRIKQKEKSRACEDRRKSNKIEDKRRTNERERGRSYRHMRKTLQQKKLKKMKIQDVVCACVCWRSGDDNKTQKTNVTG